MDKEALKNGMLSDQTLDLFFSMSRDLMHVSHEVLGSVSPLNDITKQQIGSRLQNEMLPYLLTILALTVTANRARQPAALNKPFERGES